MNLQSEIPMSLSLQVQTIDYRSLSTFDVVIINHSKKVLIEDIIAAYPDAVYQLEQELLCYHMIKSPVLVVLSTAINLLLEQHVQQCELLNKPHGLLALLDYTPPVIRANRTRISAQEYLPNEPVWSLTTVDGDMAQQEPPDIKQIAHTLGRNQIIQKNGQKKHFRYLDPQVLIHLLPLKKYAYIANRYAYPQRLWLSILDDWYSLEHIHHHTFDQIIPSQLQSIYCPLSVNQLERISMLNQFFAKEGINGNDLILNHYDTLLGWLDKANAQLVAATHLTNPVDRMTMMNGWLYECYEQSGLAAINS